MEAVGAHMVAAVLVLAIVLGPGVACVWLMLRRRRQARLQRKSPLTTNLLRPPGHTLREQLEEARFDLGFDVMSLVAIPAIGMAFLYSMTLVAGRPHPMWILVLTAVLAGACCAYQIRSLMRRGDQMDQWRLGLDAEMAAGQELDQLMRRGAAVFHDLAGEKFNIDHVVIAPQGVFAVETKSFRKPNRNGGTANATVFCDGEVLKFPEWSGSGALRQATRQAQWLSEWLTGATGERIQATPVLALPGWYVDRKGRGPVLVLSGSEIKDHLLKARNAHPLSAEQMQRVVHQVEQRCRDVKPYYRPIEEDK
jgi:hypothetical protein